MFSVSIPNQTSALLQSASQTALRTGDAQLLEATITRIVKVPDALLGQTQSQQNPQASLNPAVQITTQAGQQTLTLQINNAALAAQLVKGQVLQLQISADQTVNIVAIKPQPPRETVTNTTNTLLNDRQQLLQQALRQSLPQQQPIKELVPLLRQLLNLPSTQLPSNVAQQAQNLWQQLPNAQSFNNSDNVVRALKNSGTFLEAKFANTPGNQSTSGQPRIDINQDNKASLLRLINALDEQIPTQTLNNKPNSESTNPLIRLLTQALGIGKSSSEIPTEGELAPLPATATPKANISSDAPAKNTDDAGLLLRQLARQLTEILARTQFTQLETLVSREPQLADTQTNQQNLVIELPVVNGNKQDAIRLEIEQDNNAADAENATMRWTVIITLDMHTLGKLHAKLQLMQQEVSAVLWSEAKTTHQLVSNHVNELQTALESVGVTVNTLQCLHGQPPESAQKMQQQFVDLHL